MTFDIHGQGSNRALSPATAIPSARPHRPSSTAEMVLPGEVTAPLVELFKLLSDETRLRILFLLHQRGETNVRTLCERLHQSQPAVSHHLALMKAAGLIDMRRDGKHNFYRVIPERFEQLTAIMFAASPGEPQRLRFKDYELTYTPVSQPC